MTYNVGLDTLEITTTTGNLVIQQAIEAFIAELQSKYGQ